MNTYGLNAINQNSFNILPGTKYYYPRKMRNIVVTFFKIHNLTLNILGYFSQYSPLSGSIRIGTGLTMCVTTLLIGDRHANQGIIIRHWYDESLLTGITQIARGILEVLSGGWMINAALDAAFTVFNLCKELTLSIRCDCCISRNNPPHAEPNYIFPLKFLNLV